ncbi:MAG TPA: sodium/solute symporter [Steroidobacteraceae bacterium]|nr:sodium/solute symporter [Steroidobacteraceae bacterium]
MSALSTGASVLDLLVVLVCAGGIVGVGLAGSRRKAKAEEYFLASRASRWPAIGLALFASNISSTAIVGLAGAAYVIGIAVYDYEWSAGVVLVFYCIFLLPFVLRSRAYTMPEFLERRYDGRVRLYFAAINVFLNVFVDSAAALYCGALVCRMLLPGPPLWAIIAVLAGAAGLYTLVGGLRAVIYTEVAQAVLLIAGAITISVAAFIRAGGWQAVTHGVHPAMLSLIRPVGDPGVPWPGLVLGIPVLGFYYWCTNQYMVQQTLSARSLDDGRGGALFAGLLKLTVLFLLILPGTFALVLFPHLARPDLVYPTLMLRLLPEGFLGLVAAGFVAATMASIASTLNSASTIITMDVVKRIAPGLAEGEIVRIGRRSMAVLLLVAVLWAPQLPRFGTLWQYLQAMLAYVVPPIVTLVLVGTFWRGANAAGAAATLVLGTACGIAFFIANVPLHLLHLHFLYVAPILLGLDTAILVVASMWNRHRAPASAVASALVWTPAHYRAETERLRAVAPWRNYRVQAVGLLILTAVIVVCFR